ncbi:delta 9 fatty acid desaturase [Tieghemostelium lacteum]|uniref:Delta 9 fatty acid desaturase n=1 Tax=Tieghemostelium lacteum TaxID=361077 RepID=A0A151ZIK7_TIELA|nr:delta 9 fatty acid desaturase [Tieghemostelium lacteum]|eukprot:KYQ93745.1 delta 9 fatty acid desaturase [Tieghemostelium lacteum]
MDDNESTELMPQVTYLKKFKNIGRKLVEIPDQFIRNSTNKTGEKLPIELFEISHFKSFSLNCLNNSYFKSKSWNLAIGTLILSNTLLFPFNNQTNIHFQQSFEDRDHKYFGNLIKWLSLKKKKYLLISIPMVMLLLGGLKSLIIYYVVPWVLFNIELSVINHLPLVKMSKSQFKPDREYFVMVSHFKWFEYLIKDYNLLAIIKYLHREGIYIPHYNYRIFYSFLKRNQLLNEFISNGDLISEFMNYTGIDNQNLKKETTTPLKSSNQVNDFIISQQKKSRKIWEFLDSLNWFRIFVFTSVPAIGLYGYFTVNLQQKTLIWSFVYYQLTMLGITAGYHRLFAHRSYSANNFVKFLWIVLGAGSAQGTVLQWSSDHRVHHRYVDTPKDPYSASEGFFWSHIGWLLCKQDFTKLGKSNIDDLKSDKLVKWQYDQYLWIMLFMSFGFPTLIAGFGWNDWSGGFFYSGFIRLFFVHHSTFFVNSLAHFLGSSPYSDKNTPKDSAITAFLTCGEGYHNFHHEFPNDYRNGYEWYHYDPTKWSIKFFSYLGMAYNLKEFSENEIQKSKIQMIQKEIDSKKENIYWGIDKDQLPTLNQREFEQLVNENKRKLIIINNQIYDIESFIEDHPGGKSMILSAVGKDATKMFNGEVYDHSKAANNLLCQFLFASFNNNSNQ